MGEMARAGRGLVVGLVVGLAVAAAGRARAGDLSVRRALEAASGAIEPGCSGAVAESPQLVVTAKHCLQGDRLPIRLSTGERRTAWLVATNDASDQAVLFLEAPAGVEPLSVVRRSQIPGTV